MRWDANGRYFECTLPYGEGKPDSEGLYNVLGHDGDEAMMSPVKLVRVN